MVEQSARSCLQPLSHAVEKHNVLHEFSSHALTRPDAVALEVGETSLTYAQLSDCVARAAAYLHQHGVAQGAVVALRLTDPIELAAAMLGLMGMGATAMPVSPGSTATQVHGLVSEAKAQCLVSDPGFDVQLSCSTLLFDAALIHKAGVVVANDWMIQEPVSPCLLIVGSGTTGKPRLIPVKHAQMRTRSLMRRAACAMTPSDRVLTVSPLHFATSSQTMLAVISAGATGVIWDQYGNLASAVAKGRPDILCLSVMHAEQALLLKKQGVDFDFEPIRVVTVRSSMVSESLRQRLIRELKANLHIGYGTNEASLLSTAFPKDVDVVGGVGRPSPGVTIEIVDVNDHVVPAGDVGQIRVKSPSQIDDYLNGTDTDRFRDGWFYPGDLAKWAPGGPLVFVGRADEMMIMNGINIYPSEIEEVLGEHPAVREVAAFALRHQLAQEVPVCVVALNDCASLSKADLMDFAVARLAFKAPCVVAITSAIPRNLQGKPIRAELNALIKSELEKDAQQQTERAQALADQSHKTSSLTPHQRRRRVTFDFVLPESPNIKRLRSWHAALVGETDSEDFAGPADEPVRDHSTHTALLWLTELLGVVDALLLAARAPNFGPQKILSCTPAGQPKAGSATGWRAQVEMPLLEGHAPEMLSVALKAAIQLEAWTREHHALHAFEATAREVFFNWVKQHALAPLRGLVPGGKSSIHVLRAAFNLGVPFTHLGGGSYQLGWGAKAFVVSGSSTHGDSVVGAQLSHRKELTARLLRAAGLPGVTHKLVGTLDGARAAAKLMGWPVVVKPVDADRGEGVTVDVQAGDMDAAFAQALKNSPAKSVLVERQVEGTCHRIFVVGGELLYAVKRLPLGVYGDGQSCVGQLVDVARARVSLVPPWERSPLPMLDDLALRSLTQQGMNVAAVPKAGQFVALRRIESTAWGGVDEDVTATIHPENVRVALASAKLLGLNAAGVDLMSTDASLPWHANAAVINEVNYAPLLGEGVISRQHVQTFVTRMLKGDGRLPVEVYVGGEPALVAARQRAAVLRENGLAVALTTHEQTEAADGQAWHLAAQGLHARIRALVLSANVSALVIVVQTDELLDRNLPLEGVDALYLVDNAPIYCNADDKPQRRQALLNMLGGWVRRS